MNRPNATPIHICRSWSLAITPPISPRCAPLTR
jgi:hypothetical protein